MADLRLVGVHDDGRHLLLSGPDGDIYLLPLDEALRRAVGKSVHRSARVPQVTGTRMTPREIQTLIRAGASASDVAEQSGLTLEQVRRYEGPVLAEREYIATQARKAEVATATPHNDIYKSAFGESSATLDDMVVHRLGAFGIDPKTLRWDAWRDSAGAWTISANFDPGTAWPASSIGEPAPALWQFHPGRKALHNANRWAQQLSELEPLDSPVPERRLSAVIDKPFDVDAEPAEGVQHETDPEPEEQSLDNDRPADAGPVAGPEADSNDEDYPGHGGLLNMLRARRGVRLGQNEGGDDELAAMLGSHVPGAHPRDERDERDETVDGTPAVDAEAPVTDPPADKDRLRSIPFLKLAPRLSERDPSPTVDSVAEVSTETREIVLSGEPVTALRAPEQVPDATHDHARSAPSPQHEAPSDSEVAERLERKASGKPKRASVPSWDQIVFGTKGD